MNSNNNQFLEQVDVLIVTAIKLEYDALLKVDTGAAPSSKWEHREGPTGFSTLLFALFVRLMAECCVSRRRMR